MLLQSYAVPTPRGTSMPRIEARVAEVRIDPQNLDAYRRICGFQCGTVLPCTYLHVVATPLHLALLTDAQFPVRMFGLVHLRDRIEVLHPVHEGDVLSLACFAESERAAEDGREFEFVTQVSCG